MSSLPSRHSPGSLAALALLLIGFAGLFWFGEPWIGLPGAGYLVVHHALEMMSVVIAALIFSVAWANHRRTGQLSYTWLACGFLAVALLDFAHILSYQESAISEAPTGPGALAMGFWLLGRCVLAAVLLYLVFHEPRSRAFDVGAGLLLLLLALGGLAGIQLLVYVFPAPLPPEWRASGLEAGLQRWSEVVVIGLYTLALARVVYRWQQSWLSPLWLALGLAALLAGEICFLLYLEGFPRSLNIIGHLFKLLAYLCLYRVVFIEALDGPYRELQATNARLQSVVHAIPDLLFDLDREGRVLDVHVGEPASLRLDRAEVLGRRLPELISESAAVTLRSLLQRAEAEGYAHAEQVTVSMQGLTRHYELSLTRRHEADASPRFLMLARDVSARVRDLDIMRQLRVAVEQSPSTVMITDLESRLIYANQAFTRSTGYTLEEAMGSTPRLLHSGKTPAATYQDLWRSVAAGEAWRGEFVNQRKDGSEYLESVLISPVFDEQGKLTSYLAIKEDITAQRRDQERIRELSYFDRLTGLPNRDMLASRFEDLAVAARRQRRPLAVLCVGLDQFKRVNDTFGQPVGDEILVEMGRRLALLAGMEQFVARYAGDEFIMVLSLASLKQVARWVERLQAEIRRPCQVAEQSLVMTASVGLALLPDDGNTLTELLQRATAALGQAKGLGPEKYWFFSAELQQHSGRQLQLSNALHNAIDEGQLSLMFQPQYRLADERLAGVEALLRWRHPTFGWVSPAEFVPLAEANGMIMPIGAWVMREAVRQARRWQDQGLPPMTMAVNLSLSQFEHANLPDQLDQVLAEGGLEPHWLELELTESMAMNDPEEFLAIVGRLHQRGVQLALDDFGTGYSSFSHLRRMWLHRLKIDKSFVDDLATDDGAVSIVQAVISMARSLGLQTIAEGVETPEQVAILRHLGCNEIQGYWYSRPLTAEGLEAFVRAGAQAAIT